MLEKANMCLIDTYNVTNLRSDMKITNYQHE